MRNYVAAFDEQFAIKRNAHRSTGGLAALDGSSRPTLDGPDLRNLASGHDHDLVSGAEPAGFDAARDNAAVVEFVDRLHRQPQRKLLRRPGGLKRVERFHHGRSIVPADPRCTLRDAVAVARRNRNYRRRLDAKADEMRGDLVADFLESRRAEIDPIHLVDDNGDLFDAKKMQKIAVAPGLVAHAFQRVDDQKRAVRLRSAGDHVAQEFGVAGCVDQHDVARPRAEPDLRGVDGDALVALGLQRVQQERPLERHAASRADRP